MAPEMSHGLQMQMGTRLETRLMPQMIQSMELLQLPILELEQRIQQELLENPALELLEMRDADGNEPGEQDEAYAENEMESDDANHDLRKIDEMDYDWDEFYDESAPRRPAPDDERFDIIENAVSPQKDFREYLVDQLGEIDTDPRTRELASRIIYNLEDNGYLATPLLETVNGEVTPPPSEEELRRALALVQTLDPAGVGARDLKECLLLQLDAKSNNGFSFERGLIERHLENLAANRLPQIARAEKCDIEDVKDAIQFIRTLNPHPGLDFGRSAAVHVKPDAVTELAAPENGEIEKLETTLEKRRAELRQAERENTGPEGEWPLKVARTALVEAETELELLHDEHRKWEVRLADGRQPYVSDLFVALFDNSQRGKQMRASIEKDPERAEEFRQMQAMVKHGEQGKVMREKYNTARWLVSAIDLRGQTLYRVTRQIVAKQKDFLSGKADAPAPLMMQDVAARLEIDTSTVSRTVREKYLDTPMGIRPLRFFFTRAVGDSGDKATSNVHIMNRVREIIDAEDKKKPLKDDEIQKLLAADGIDIKRRTVAKYRTNLGYPKHTQRLEY